MGLNQMLDAILLPIGEGNRILAQVSNGKIDELIAQTYKGDHEKMKQAVNNVAVVLQGLQKEMARLTEASREGLLSDRGQPEQFQGAYADIVRGVNQMLDAILLPNGLGVHGRPGDSEELKLRRRSLVGSQLLGIACNRYLMRMEPMASASRTEVARWARPTIDRYATGAIDE